MIKIESGYLHQICQPITFEFPKRNSLLANQLVTYMNSQKALGLAANQVGINKRVFVMRKHDGVVLKCFNPEIVGHNEHYEIHKEGCLSFPGEFVDVPRLTGVRVKYQTNSGEWVLGDLYGLDARVFQHELDHLNGVTMHDVAIKQECGE